VKPKQLEIARLKREVAKLKPYPPAIGSDSKMYDTYRDRRRKKGAGRDPPSLSKEGQA